jgi:hypothetical protein
LAIELERNEQIARIASVPLFLQMLLSVFRAGSPYHPLPNASDEEQIRELISSYVELRLAGDTAEINKQRFTIPSLRRWLSWLARNQNRSPFLIELMQPDMLPKSDQRLYKLLAACLMAVALTVCAVVPAAAGLGVGWAAYRGPVVWLQIGLIATPVVLIDDNLIWRGTGTLAGTCAIHSSAGERHVKNLSVEGKIDFSQEVTGPSHKLYY